MLEGVGLATAVAGIIGLLLKYYLDQKRQARKADEAEVKTDDEFAQSIAAGNMDRASELLRDRLRDSENSSAK